MKNFNKNFFPPKIPLTSLKPLESLEAKFLASITETVSEPSPLELWGRYFILRSTSPLTNCYKKLKNFQEFFKNFLLLCSFLGLRNTIVHEFLGPY